MEEQIENEIRNFGHKFGNPIYEKDEWLYYAQDEIRKSIAKILSSHTTSLLELIEKEKSEDDNEKQQWILLKRYWWDAGLSKAQSIISKFL